MGPARLPTDSFKALRHHWPENLAPLLIGVIGVVLSLWLQALAMGLVLSLLLAATVHFALRDRTRQRDAIRQVENRTAELAKQAEELKRSNTELEQFAYVASHDLQEPLRMVKSYTELMEKRLAAQLDDKDRKYLRYIVEGAERMQSLINDLLGYSRVGRRELEWEELDTNRVVFHVVTLLSSAIADQPGAKVTWDHLPTVLATESMMVQLFQNLIANGLKFHGDEPPRVHISCERRAEEWCFSVADNGIGIDSKYADRIFLVFQRLHERHRYQGTGIGLSVAERIVERHGGRIWFESEPGHGTTFYFTLPILPPAISGRR